MRCRVVAASRDGDLVAALRRGSGVAAWRRGSGETAWRRGSGETALRRGNGVAALPRVGLVAAILVAAGAVRPLHAQSAFTQSGPSAPVHSDQPVTFTADSVEYDRDQSLVTATGHVEAWQNDHVLHADKVTFDRNTSVLAAYGHVVLMEPDGEIMFADYAEMNQGMKEGVLRDMQAILAQNGRLAANGARRTAGELNEFSHVVYSTCNLCKTDPSKAPLWQLRADKAVQDLEHKKIEYEDAVLQMYGIPVAYMPYFWHVDPSVKRASGLLVPSAGATTQLGTFYAQPYYWVIDDQSDATFTPMITTHEGPQIDIEYRRLFNDGTLLTNASAGYDHGSPQGTIYLKGQFDYDDTWRYGFNVNRASSGTYLYDFRLSPDLGSDPNLLTSQIYLEGFGVGAYTRLDTKFYQGVNDAIADSKLPLVLPRYQYSYFGQPDGWGGRLSFDAGMFNVVRTDGTNTRRASLTTNWDRPLIGPLGDVWTFRLHGDAAAYDASSFNQQPNFGTQDQVDNARALPQAAIDWRWPFMRDSGSWGNQIIEPMAELIVAPREGASQLNKYPNEDSLDLEFSDANLFGFNRFPGIDRLEGGDRVNLGLHSAWYLNGTAFDSLVGQSYRTFKDNLFAEATGLHDQVSDVVARATLSPTNWLDLTYRTRLDHNTLASRMIDAFASAGPGYFKVSAGYLHTDDDPYQLFDQPLPPPTTTNFYTPRNEVTFGLLASQGPYKLKVSAQRNLQTNSFDTIQADAIYEDECFIMDLRLYRRYTDFNGDNGSSAVLVQLTFKTVGTFGFRAM
jgi:LPS-assembly protein